MTGPDLTDEQVDAALWQAVAFYQFSEGDGRYSEESMRDAYRAGFLAGQEQSATGVNAHSTSPAMPVQDSHNDQPHPAQPASQEENVMTTIRIRLLKTVHDLLQAFVEVDEAELNAAAAEWSKKRPGGLVSAFTDLEEQEQVEVLEGLAGGDLEFDFYQCGDSDGISVEEITVVERSGVTKSGGAG